MNAIQQYIDNLFAGLPVTAKSEQLKRDLLADSQQRYNDLLAEGKTPDEALGQVVTHFGSMDDILEQLGGPAQPLHTAQGPAAPAEPPQAANTARHVADAVLGVPHQVLWVSLTAIYLVVGILFKVWHPTWLIFAIPAALSIPGMGGRNLQAVIWSTASIVYVVLGFLFNWWHPGWLIFMVALVAQVMLEHRQR